MYVQLTGTRWQVATSQAQVDALVDQVAALAPEPMVLEASGGYEAPAVAALVSRELPVVVVNLRQVRDFARATGQLAKTDLIDAQVLAQFGEAIQPQLRPYRMPPRVRCGRWSAGIANSRKCSLPNETGR